MYDIIETIETARATCQTNFQGQLLSITSDDEHEAVKAFLISQNIRTEFMLDNTVSPVQLGFGTQMPFVEG